MELAESLHTILVEPGESMNVGSAARAIKNLGFRKLRLVAPRSFDLARAKITACWADDILADLQQYPTIAEAVSDVTLVAGFAARTGKNRLEHFELADFLERLGATLHQGGKVALLFGPEDTGLHNEHIEHCHCLVRIPSAPDCPAFNLAQAVLLALSEIRRTIQPFSTTTHIEPPATMGELQTLDRVVDELMRRSGFDRDGTPAPVPAMLRQLMRRIAPSQRELGVLLGFLGRLNRVVKGESPGYPMEPESTERTWMKKG